MSEQSSMNTAAQMAALLGLDPMAVVIEANTRQSDGSQNPWRTVYYKCPGCNDVHNVRVREHGALSPSWIYSGDATRPTFEPSVNYTSRVCHHYVRGGRIEFLGDCTHAMKGTTVDLPTLAEWTASEVEFFGDEKHRGP